ncbi:unnamed protein product [Clonostachys chloroleuca]|uniref:Uncharacterized protein n=1 Tax=Clonostachys chloroleuca TaxID=1926264 RepID=A0AA35MIJ3_9HYPO|nr:unnamed protein product [Clonostachys chloroleuca]
MVNTYVIVPNFTTSPPPVITYPESTPSANGKPPLDPFSIEAGRVQLGDVLADPFGPEIKALNRADRKKINGKFVDRTSEHGGLKAKRRELFDGRLGIWANLLATLGLGPSINISIHWESKSDDEIEAEALWTYSFDPDDTYVKSVLQSNSVKSYLDKYPEAPLYMVSGLKVAHGAKASSTASNNVDGNAGAEASSGIANLKLLNLIWNRSKHVSFKTATDFVLAVQLRHIMLDGQGEPIHSVSVKNTSMADGTAGSGGSDWAKKYQGTEGDIKRVVDHEQYENINGEGVVVLLPDVESEDDY